VNISAGRRAVVPWTRIPARSRHQGLSSFLCKFGQRFSFCALLVWLLLVIRG
jgi:hypothetical protein